MAHHDRTQPLGAHGGGTAETHRWTKQRLRPSRAAARR